MNVFDCVMYKFRPDILNLAVVTLTPPLSDRGGAKPEPATIYGGSSRAFPWLELK
jgi:hypothetical protein